MSRIVSGPFNSIFYAGCTTQKWLTTKIVDASGNYALINYDTANEPLSVVTNDGRIVSYTKTYDESGNVIELKIAYLDKTFTYKYTLFSENPYPIGSESRILIGASSYKVLSSTVNQIGEQTSYEYEKLFRIASNGYYASPPSNNEFFGIIKNQRKPKNTLRSYAFQSATIEQIKDMSTSVVYGAAYQPIIVSRNAIDSSNNIISQFNYSYAVEGSGFVGASNKSITTLTTNIGKTIYKHFRFNPSIYQIKYDYDFSKNAYYPYFSGNYYLYGALASITQENLTGNTLQTQIYTYSKFRTGSELRRKSIAGVLFQDDANYVPLMASSVISRDGVNYTTTYTNPDAYGNPQTITESGPNGGNRVTTKTYYNNPATWVIGKPLTESFTGSNTTRGYFPTGNLQSHTHNGVTTSYTYDAQGNRSSVTYPRGLTHTYSDHYRGTPRTESQPEGITIRRTINDTGTVASETNGENYTTQYAYDGLNRITRVTPPTGNVINIAYTPASKNASRGPLLETTLYDGLGRPTGINLGGIARVFNYDALGRKTFESNSNVADGVTYGYDVIGRLTRKTNPDASYSTISYGAGTRTVTNELGHATTTAYRSYGNPDEQYAMSVTRLTS
jgi:YD repeat-containing protein